MFLISYVLIVVFHPNLNLKKLIIQRSFGHLLKELTTINYSTDNQMKFIDIQILNQHKDIAIDVSKRKCKNTIAQIFCIESAFVKKTLLSWLNKKTKSQHLKINAFMKIQYERKKSYFTEKL